LIRPAASMEQQTYSLNAPGLKALNRSLCKSVSPI
jgi:hypothetical protein